MIDVISDNMKRILISIHHREGCIEALSSGSTCEATDRWDRFIDDIIEYSNSPVPFSVTERILIGSLLDAIVTLFFAQDAARDLPSRVKLRQMLESLAGLTRNIVWDPVKHDFASLAQMVGIFE